MAIISLITCLLILIVILTFSFQVPFLGEFPSTSWVDTLKSTIGFGSVSLSIDSGHIQSWHAYSYKKAYAGVTLLFYRSLAPHIKALIEHAVWNCTRQMHPVTYFGAWKVPMLCEFPQYIGWGLTGQPIWWLEVWLCTLGKHSLYPYDEYVLCITLILCYCSCCVLFTIFCFLLLIFKGVII